MLECQDTDCYRILSAQFDSCDQFLPPLLSDTYSITLQPLALETSGASRNKHYSKLHCRQMSDGHSKMKTLCCRARGNNDALVSFP